MSERKPYLLRVDPAVFDALQKWAADDLRSVNAQIEYVLRDALSRAGRRRVPVRGAGADWEGAAVSTIDELFKPGLYRHYKGGLYTAVCLVTHHETRRPMVLYVSHTYGGTNVRPLAGWPGDQDAWLGYVRHEGDLVARFTFVGDLPSDTKIGERK